MVGSSIRQVYSYNDDIDLGQTLLSAIVRSIYPRQLSLGEGDDPKELGAGLTEMGQGKFP